MNYTKTSDTTITGYRTLTPKEIVLINIVKHHGERIEELVAMLDGELKAQYGEADGPESARIDHAQPGRWLMLGRTHLQEGLMALTRAVAQPTSF